MNSRDISKAVKRLLENQKIIENLSLRTFEEIADFSAVGRLAIYFNLLDQSLLYLAIDLFGFRDPGIGMELLKTWTVDQNLEAIKKVMPHYRSMTLFQEEEMKSAMRLLGDIKEISAERNKWIHGFFSDSGTENEKRTLSHPKWQRSLTLDSAEITPLIDRMINASKRLGQLADLAQERLQILNRVIRQMETDDADLHRPED